MPNKIKKILSFLTLSFLFAPLAMAGVCISGSNVFDTKCSGYGASTLTQTLLNYGNATFIKNFAGVPVGTSGSLNADYSAGSGTATFTATRSSTTPATYVDANGIIQLTTTSNVPRITSGFYNSTGFVSRPGLIVEGASTNLIVRTDGSAYSSNLWTGWTLGSDITGTATNSNVLVPELTGIASSASQRLLYTGIVTDTSKTYSIISANTGAGSFVNGQTGTFSVWLRSQTGVIPPLKIEFNVRNSGGTLLESYNATVSPTTSWKRFTVTGTTAQATADRISAKVGCFGNIDNGELMDVEVWGPQFEVLPFATTFIPTTTAALTRNAETLTYPIASNRTAATESIFAKFTPFWSGTQPTAPFRVHDTDTKLRQLVIETVSDKFVFRPNITDSASSDVASTTTPQSSTSYVVASIAYGPTQAINAEIYLNGLSEGTDSDNYTSPAWGTNFYVGSSSVAARELHGIIESLAIFSDAKSAADVSNISEILRN